MILDCLFCLLALSFVTAKSIGTKDSCPVSQISFFVIDNAFMQLNDSIVYKDTSEDECMNICKRNRDQFERPITCYSFTYDHASFSCTVHKEKLTPVGSGNYETAVGKRYFEKLCLPQSSVKYCSESQFIRVDQSVLVGYAVNMTLTDSIESCVAQCIQEKECKSAMYFYEDGECITNKESALSKPSGFTKEENDRVVYFQNGCGLAKKSTEEIRINSSENPDENDDQSDIEKPKVNVQISETTPKPTAKKTEVIENVETVETPSNDKNDTEYVEDADEDDSEEGSHEKGTSEKIEAEEPEVATTTTTVAPIREIPQRIKASLQKKIKKHPKNFGSKTYEILKQDATKQSKIESNKVHPEEVNFSPEEIEENYFSEWSDWTPCTKSNERQVRRRRCLNLRKCLGALMQVQNCPEILQTTTSVSRESVRSIVSVDGEEYDEPISVDNITVETAVSRIVPTLSEQVWGMWQGSCQHFASSQPCNNGNMIGFESRECIAKNPSDCEGPFFRYCTLSC